MKKYFTIIISAVLLVSCTSNTDVKNEEILQNSVSSENINYATWMEISVIDDNFVSENIEKAENNSIISDEIQTTEIDSNF